MPTKINKGGMDCTGMKDFPRYDPFLTLMLNTFLIIIGNQLVY